MPQIAGLRMHYVDEGPRDAAGHCAVPARPAELGLPVPQDDPGVHRGRAARGGAGLVRLRPLRQAARTTAWYSFDGIATRCSQFVEQLDLRNVLLVVQDWGGLLGLTLPLDAARALHPAAGDEHRPGPGHGDRGLQAVARLCQQPARPGLRQADPARHARPDARPRPRPTTRRSPTCATRPACAPSRTWCPTVRTRPAPTLSRRAAALLEGAVGRATASWPSA